MQLIRGSEMHDFLADRLTWKWRWVDGYVPVSQNKSLAFGTIVHKHLELLYNGMAHRAAHGQVKELYPDTDPDVWGMYLKITDRYWNKYREHDRENWRVIATELKFAIPLDDKIAYTGTIDLIVCDAEKRLFFLDHKTTNSIDKYEKNSIMDQQISRYWWALQQLAAGKGYIWYEPDQKWLPVEIWSNMTPEGSELQAPDGFLYNIILKDVPEPPRVLKNGSLSKDKAQKTTYDLYTKALEDQSIDGVFWDEYRDILDHLLQNPREYFRRTMVVRNQREINESMKDFYAVAREMMYVRNVLKEGDPETASHVVYRTIDSRTPSSPYADIIKASLDGSDVEYLLKFAFIKEELENELQV